MTQIYNIGAGMEGDNRVIHMSTWDFKEREKYSEVWRGPRIDCLGQYI